MARSQRHPNHHAIHQAFAATHAGTGQKIDTQFGGRFLVLKGKMTQKMAQFWHSGDFTDQTDQPKPRFILLNHKIKMAADDGSRTHQTTFLNTSLRF